MIATRDVDALLAMDADCVVYSPVIGDPDVVARILRSGKNVVTPLGWVYPDPDRAKGGRLDAACIEGGATLHGTGIHPGGITERFPLMVSALSGSVTHVRAEEFSDIRTYNAPDVVRDIMLFDSTPEDAQRSMMPAMLANGFGQSVHMVADVLGFPIEPELRDDARDGRRHGADRLTDRRDRARTCRRAAVPLGGHRRRGAGRDRRGELVHGRRAPRPGLDVRPRARALRDRGHRRPGREADVPRAAPGVDRRGPRAQTRASSPRRCTA